MKSKNLLCLVALSVIISQGFLLQNAHAQTSTGQTVSANRLAGENRYDTSIAISQAGWDKSDTIILTSGEKFADSLCAGPLAKKYNAPILLTTSTSISDNTLKELTRLQAKNIIIVGGTGSVSSNVENQLKSSGFTNIDRIGGKNRYETSSMIAEKLDKTDKAIIASGENFPDALSIASVASKLEIPILLSNKDSLSQDAKQFIESNNIKQTYIVGGQGVLSSSIEKSLPSPVRLSGSNRYETNLTILKQFYKDLNFDSIYLASGGGSAGNEFADALSGAALARKTSSPILLTDNSIDKALNEFIKTKLNIETKAVALGGKAVLSDSLVKNIMDEKASVSAAKVYDKAGSYTGDTINGLAIISVPDVQLKDTTINGDLLITSSVGEGSVGLNNVNVTGKIIVNGGGAHSVEADNSKAQELEVDKPVGDGVRVELNNGTRIPSVKVYSDATLDTLTKESAKDIGAGIGIGFNNGTDIPYAKMYSEAIATTTKLGQGSSWNFDLSINNGGTAELDGIYGNIELQGLNGRLNLVGASVNALHVDVRDYKSGLSSQIHLNENSTIDDFTADSVCSVTGQGTIGNAYIKAANVTIEQKPRNVYITPGITATIGGQTQIGTSSSSSGGGYVSYKTIATAAAITDINVDNGTSLSAISLPQNLNITLNDGTTTSAGIVWDNGAPTYDGNTTGIYEFTGNIVIPQGVTNPNNITAKVRIVVGNPYAGSKIVTTVSAIEDKNVDNGTSLSAISLPQNLNITLSDGTTTSASLTWDNGTPAYDENIPGIYEFTGTISLPKDVINPANVKAKVKVVVGNANNESGGGNSPGNIMNGGFAVEREGWIYYSNLLDKEKLYKIKTDGTGKVKLNDDENSYSINLVGDNIYYIVDGNKINKIKTDGSGENTITEAYVNRMSVVGDKMYYISCNDDYYTEGYLYRMNLDGSSNEKISEDKAKMFNVIGDHVYYISANDSEGDTENGKVYSINLDGTGKAEITEDAATYMNVAEDGVYYASKDDGDKIYKVNLDGTGKTKISDIKAEDIIYKDGWLYSENIIDKTLYKIKSDGSQNTVLLQGSYYLFNISGDWIYYVDIGDINKIQDGDIVIYRMKTDGSSKETFALNVVSIPDTTIAVEQGGSLELPEYVDAITQEGTTIKKSVNWDTAVIDTTELETYTVNGTVSGYNGSVTLKVNVVEPGSTDGNILNSGHFNQKGDWIYFSNYSDGEKLYKIKTDGTEITKICDDTSDSINVVGDWIYYNCSGSSSVGNNGTYKIKTDGTERTKLSDNYSMNMMVLGDNIYFLINGEDKIYKMNTDGTGKTTVGDNETFSSLNFSISNGWIYYDDYNERSLCRMKLDGSSRENLSGDWAHNIIVRGDWVYYTVGLYGTIYKIKTDGSSRTRINDDNAVGYINIDGDWIYYGDTYGNGTNDYKLYKIKTDGTGKTKLSDNQMGTISIAGQSIYYTNGDFTKINKIQMDGSPSPAWIYANSIPNITVNAVQNGGYSLPQTLMETTEDGVSESVPVTWNPPVVSTSNLGAYTYKGTINGYTGNVNLILNVIEKGNTSGNITNNGICVEKGEYIYYPGDSSYKLYKSKADGSQLALVCNDACLSVNVVGDWIYYSNTVDGGKLYKIKTDGSSKTKLSEDAVETVNAFQDWIYYVNDSDGYKPYKVKIDGTVRTKLSDDSAIFATTSANNIFYSNRNDGCIYKINFDGTGKVKLTNGVSSYLNLVGDWIYFNYKDNTNQFNFYKIKTDGTGMTCIKPGDFEWLNVVENTIYYVSNGNLYKANIDGSTAIKISDDNASLVNVCGDWIYYSNNSDGKKIYRIKTDGTGRQAL